MSTETANRHADLSRWLIQEASYELEQKGDRVQACEKASGAVAQAVKATAEDRQWRHGSHHLRRTIVDIIAAEYSHPDLVSLQAVADQMHENFYEDRMEESQLEERLARISYLVDTLLEVRELGPKIDFVPSPNQQRTIDRLRLSEEEAATDPLIDFPPPMPPFVPPEN